MRSHLLRTCLFLIFSCVVIASAWSQPFRTPSAKYVAPLFKASGTEAQAAPAPEDFSDFLPYEEMEDSLQYYRRPPIRGQDIPLQFIGGIGGGVLGAIGGALFGVLVGLVIDPNQAIWWLDEWAAAGAVTGLVFGVPLGIWIGGNNYFSKGSYWITFGSQIAGLLTAFLFSWLVQDFGFFVASSVILPYAGGMVGYNLSRKWRVYEEEEQLYYDGDEYYEYLHEPPTLPKRVPRLRGPQFRIFNFKF